MAAVIDRRDIMQAAQNSFISSTYWTEAIGPTAALATIKKMREVNVADHVNKVGMLVQEGWQKVAAKHGLKINIEAWPALCHFNLNHAE